MDSCLDVFERRLTPQRSRPDMYNSRLGRLPAELRNGIWELALYPHDGLFIERTSKKFTRLYRSTSYSLTLLRVCRTTYIE